MLLKSCKAFTRAKAVTSSTTVKEKADLLIQCGLNVRHGSAEDRQKNWKCWGHDFRFTMFYFTFMAPCYGWGSTASKLQSYYEEAV